MEHALREKAKAFWAMRRSYEAIAKHNQVSDAGAEQGDGDTRGCGGEKCRWAGPGHAAAHRVGLRQP